MWKSIKCVLERFLLKRKLHRMNPTNYTYAVNIFNPNLVQIGEYTYGSLHVLDSGKCARLKVGSFCSISAEVGCC